MESKFELYKSKDGFRFRLKASNGQIILVSESYKSKKDAEKGIYSVKSNARAKSRFDTLASKDKKPYFNLKSINGEVIGTSEMYESSQAMKNGIQSVIKNAPIATIYDISEAFDKPVRFNNVTRIGNEVFVAPFAKIKQRTFQKSIIKVNRSEVKAYLSGNGALEHFLMDFNSFNYVTDKKDLENLARALEAMASVVRKNPSKIHQALNSLSIHGGYTNEIGEILNSLIMDNEDLTNFESSTTGGVLMMMNTTELCASNDVHRPGDEGPGGDNHPYGDDPGAGGENPDGGEDEQEDDDEKKEEDGSN